MKTNVTVKKVDANNKYYPMYHIEYNDYRGKNFLKLDEETARLLVSELDKKINFTEKV